MCRITETLMGAIGVGEGGGEGGEDRTGEGGGEGGDTTVSCELWNSTRSWGGEGFSVSKFCFHSMQILKVASGSLLQSLYVNCLVSRLEFPDISTRKT